ncbi:MAG TPA: ribosome-associated translation inhibitor RaiA [Chloroflexia bacterium]|nr:ribosome-associated translation inhibitor RaiA [Chloroflexia bacterium]
MDVTMRLKNFKLSSTQETQIRKRLERLTRQMDQMEYNEVLISQEPTKQNPQRHEYVVQITLRTRSHNLIRSEVHNTDLLSAVDDAIGRLSRQIERFKGRFYNKKKGKLGVGESSARIVSATPAPNGSDQSVSAADFTTGPLGDEDLGEVVRVKRFEVKPMFPEEAVEQMELLGHDFYVFYNAGENELNVLYRRTDGNYGLLQPELN